MKRGTANGRGVSEGRMRMIRKTGELVHTARLPANVTPGLPCVRLEGDSRLLVENGRGVLELKTGLIRLYTGLGILRIEGSGLRISRMDALGTLIEGRIEAVLYENNEQKR